MKAGTQIAYIPMHAEGNINHPDVEFGFVTGLPRMSAWYDGMKPNAIFCRYWSKYHDGLRTKANSELTPIECLVEHTTRPQHVIDNLLTELGYIKEQHERLA